ncbi:MULTISPECIES: glycosyltransferase family 8 protein [unclassified Methylobacterium]|jgi:lipopolysaccharide biosynthesis glycosyltransferase|uniref:glycosyltransferase family 8 protein n=1 Tax=unclassified Methylobacterium TaxID=2615210 RepID=UPI001353034F|nr:glycosyltransferase [Methylobacterium sp. 2A]MWV23316.1 hypothetical protein [Methylobacterium sp. 2A]
MQENCVCYAVDSNYLFPATLSALQVRSKTPQDRADVAIVCFDEPNDNTRLASTISSTYGITFIQVPQAELEGVPLAYARLFLDKALPTQYKNLVYIDGDTQVPNSLEDLFGPGLAQYDFMAARDAMTLIVNDNTRLAKRIKRYFRTLEIDESDHERYFNSGVMKLKRSVIGDLRSEIKGLLARKTNEFTFFDQDALNIVLSGNKNLMSMKWNFPTFLMNYSHFREVPAHLLHFCSNPRPWHGPFHPWGESYFQVYTEFAKSFPNTNQKTQPLTGLRKVKYILQTRYKSIVEPYLWDNAYSRNKRVEQESDTII